MARGALVNTVMNDLGSEVLTAVAMKSSVAWSITPCRPLKVNRRFGRTYRLHHHGRRIKQARNPHQTNRRSLLATFFIPIYCLAYFSTMMMKATCSSETSVASQLATQRYIPKDRCLLNNGCENLRSFIVGTLIEISRI
jgi:hypothetical protein